MHKLTESSSMTRLEKSALLWQQCNMTSLTKAIEVEISRAAKSNSRRYLQNNSIQLLQYFVLKIKRVVKTCLLATLPESASSTLGERSILLLMVTVRGIGGGYSPFLSVAVYCKTMV